MFERIKASSLSLNGRNTVFGVGINDAPYEVTLKNKSMCPIYSAWKSMLCRCYGATIPKYYEECTVVKEWHLFSNFLSWAETQDYIGNQLDKDFRVPGNKVYGPDTCVFIPNKLNQFFKPYRGKYAKDVYPNGTGRFIARIKFDGVRCGLGFFDNINDAIKAVNVFLAEKLGEIALESTNPFFKQVLDTKINELLGEPSCQ